MRATFGLVLLLISTVSWANAPRSGNAAEGGRLYREECAPCHGTTAHGEGAQAWLFSPPPPNLRVSALDRHDPETLVRRILDGVTERISPGSHALVESATRTEALVDHLQRIPRVDWTRVARGRSVYRERCERCHGAFGRPSPDVTGDSRPRDLEASALPVDDGQLALLVRHRRKGLPALSEGLPDADVPALIAFLRLLTPGYEAYEVICARCHGDSGVPPRGHKGPTVVFDRAYFAAHDTGVVRTKVWHMLGEPKQELMPHFRGELTKAQARAIVDYLQLLPAD